MRDIATQMRNNVAISWLHMSVSVDTGWYRMFKKKYIYRTSLQIKSICIATFIERFSQSVQYNLLLTWFGRWTWLARRVRSQTSFGQRSFWWCSRPASGATHTFTSATADNVHANLQSHTCLEDLWARFIVGFGILDQQVYVLSHGIDARVVANLKSTHLCA